MHWARRTGVAGRRIHSSPECQNQRSATTQGLAASPRFHARLDLPNPPPRSHAATRASTLPPRAQARHDGLPALSSCRAPGTRRPSESHRREDNAHVDRNRCRHGRCAGRYRRVQTRLADPDSASDGGDDQGARRVAAGHACGGLGPRGGATDGCWACGPGCSWRTCSCA